MPTVIKGQPTSQEVLQRLADEGRPVGLAFSCGKDSVATWLAMREYGIEVVPVYWWLVPELGFVEDSLRYYEDFFGVPITRLPNPRFYEILYECLYQPPERLRTIEALPHWKLTHDMLWAEVFKDRGLPGDTWKANGTRAADSLMRRTAFMRHGVMREGSRNVSPIADWLKAEVYGIIDRYGVRLPVDYEMFGRSFDGLDKRYTMPIKERFPEDFERIKAFFPLCDADHWRGGVPVDEL